MDTPCDEVVTAFLERAGLGSAPEMVDVVEALRDMPYGRPSVRDTTHAVAEWRGTCSTKHALLVQVLGELFPGSEPQVIHRVYRVVQAFAPAGTEAVVPGDGLVDVHRFVTVRHGGRRIVLDVTFPGLRWDGASSMRPACWAGVDYPVVGDVDRHKAELERRFCDPRVREPFIAALADRGGR